MTCLITVSRASLARVVFYLVCCADLISHFFYTHYNSHSLHLFLLLLLSNDPRIISGGRHSLCSEQPPSCCRWLPGRARHSMATQSNPQVRYSAPTWRVIVCCCCYTHTPMPSRVRLIHCTTQLVAVTLNNRGISLGRCLPARLLATWPERCNDLARLVWWWRQR